GHALGAGDRCRSLPGDVRTVLEIPVRLAVRGHGRIDRHRGRVLSARDPGHSETPLSAALRRRCTGSGEPGGRMSEVLEVRDVSKRYGGIVANHKVSLSVEEGQIVGLIGPNGSGKTTLFNSIVDTHPIDGGSIRFDGSEISRLRVAEIARLGLIRT